MLKNPSKPTEEAKEAFIALLDPKTPQAFGSLWSDKKSCALGELLYNKFNDMDRDHFTYKETSWLDKNVPRTVQKMIVRLNDAHKLSKQEIGVLLMDLYP